MLTDYHVHLRPDEDDTPAEDYFTPGNVERYREVAEDRGIAELGVAEHIHRFTQSLDIWQHPWWIKWAHDDVDAYCEFVREETDLRLGIEADFVAGAEDRIANFLDAARVGLRRRLGALPARRGGRHGRLERVGPRRVGREDLEALLRHARGGRGARGSTTSWPTPTW